MIARIQPESIKQKYKQIGSSDETLNRLELERIRGQCLSERSSFISHWQEISQFLAPRRARYWVTDRDRGNRRNYSIINSTGTHAWHTLQAGMMSGFTSQSRQWFRLSTMDPDLAKVEAVKEWLDMVSWMMADVFLRSNVYTTLMNVYGDMGGFGTACMFLQEDFDRVIHTYSILTGSYFLIPNDKWEIDGFIRDYMMTVRQIVEQFAVIKGTNRLNWDNVSTLVKGLWDAGNTEAWINVSHAILPNPKWKPESAMSASKKYVSVYWERGTVAAQNTLSTIDSTKVLSRKGFDKFRVMAPRWEVGAEDIYGTYCPGMEALGDIQGLQTYEKRGAQALEKSINPALVGPSSLKNSKTSVVPGDITYVDSREGGQKLEPVYQINPNFQQYNVEKQSIQDRIKKSFKSDLFLVISNLERGSGVTAEEIRALQGEKLQEIGPIIAPLNQGLLDPLVEQTFDIMNAQGRLPPPPQVMRNVPLKVVYLSIVGQAQKAIAAGSIEQFWGFAMKVKESSPEDPSILDPINTDEMLDRYAEDLTIPPGIIRDEDEVQKMRAQRQAAQQKQAQLAQAEQASKTAKNLAGAPTDGSNALTELLQQGKAGSLGPGQ